MAYTMAILAWSSVFMDGFNDCIFRACNGKDCIIKLKN